MSSSPLSKTGHQVLKTTGRLNARAADLKQKTMAKLGTYNYKINNSHKERYLPWRKRLVAKIKAEQSDVSQLSAGRSDEV